MTGTPAARASPRPAPPARRQELARHRRADHRLLLVGHVLADVQVVDHAGLQERRHRARDELRPELGHLAHQVRVVHEHHAEPLEAEPLAHLPERPGEGDGADVVALAQAAAAVGEVLREAAGLVGVVARLHPLPVGPRLDRQPDPLARDEVDGLAQVDGVEPVGDLADVALPVLHDVVAVAVLEDLLLELGDHPEVDAVVDVRAGRAPADADLGEQNVVPVPLGRQPLGAPGFEGGLAGPAGRERHPVRRAEGEGLDEAFSRVHGRAFYHGALPPQAPASCRRASTLVEPARQDAGLRSYARSCRMWLSARPFPQETAMSASATLYPAPPGVEPSADFRLWVDGQEAFVHSARGTATSLCSLDGPAEVEVETQFEFKKVVVRPLRHGIRPTLDWPPAAVRPGRPGAAEHRVRRRHRPPALPPRRPAGGGRPLPRRAGRALLRARQGPHAGPDRPARGRDRLHRGRRHRAGPHPGAGCRRRRRARARHPGRQHLRARTRRAGRPG